MQRWDLADLTRGTDRETGDALAGGKREVDSDVSAVYPYCHIISY